MVKASVYNAGDPGSIPGLGRSPGEGNGNLLQGVAKSQTRLSDFTFTFKDDQSQWAKLEREYQIGGMAWKGGCFWW